MKRVSLFVVALFAAATAMADADAYIRREAWGQKSYPAAPHVVEQASLEAAVTLSADGAVDQLEAIRMWNAAGKIPARGGFERPIPDGLSVQVTPSYAS